MKKKSHDRIRNNWYVEVLQRECMGKERKVLAEDIYYQFPIVFYKDTPLRFLSSREGSQNGLIHKIQ